MRMGNLLSGRRLRLTEMVASESPLHVDHPTVVPRNYERDENESPPERPR